MARIALLYAVYLLARKPVMMRISPVSAREYPNSRSRGYDYLVCCAYAARRNGPARDTTAAALAWIIVPHATIARSLVSTNAREV